MFDSREGEWFAGLEVPDDRISGVVPADSFALLAALVVVIATDVIQGLGVGPDRLHGVVGAVRRGVGRRVAAAGGEGGDSEDEGTT